MFIVYLILSIIYFFILLIFILGIFRLKRDSNTKIQNISVIIAARNEEQHLPGLLDKLVNQSYPKENYEIVIADDRSEDSTSQIVQDYQKDYFNIKLVKIEHENKDLVGKKAALDAAIRISEYKILAFTDADCLPGKNWLSEINRHFTSNIDYIAGYSPLLVKNKFLYLLKNLERVSIFAITAGSFGWNWGLTCTARNLAYRKNLYEQVNGFSGIGHLRSGDDDLMLQKMNKYIRKMHFMFSLDSIVSSFDKEKTGEQVNLESRRASKWKYYPFGVKVLTLFLFLYYLFFISCLIYVIAGHLSFFHFFLLLMIKIIPEFVLIFVFLYKVKKKRFLWVFPIAEIIYIPYFIFFGLKGTFGKYIWKD